VQAGETNPTFIMTGILIFMFYPKALFFRSFLGPFSFGGKTCSGAPLQVIASSLCELVAPRCGACFPLC